MKTLNKETTLGELAASFTEMVIDNASQKMVNSGSLPGNIVKANVFNMSLVGSIQIIVKYSINGVEYIVEDILSSIRPDDQVILNITPKGSRENLFITQKILHQMGEDLKIALIKSIQI